MSGTYNQNSSSAESGQTSTGDNIWYTGDQTITSPTPSNIDPRGRDLLEGEDMIDQAKDEASVELWDTLRKSFHEVQLVLDQNRVLIQQVNENHQSRDPENLARNVALIREINGNVGKVVSLYSSLSAHVSQIFIQRKSHDHQMA